MCPNLAANSSLFARVKFENWCPPWQPAGWREGRGTSHNKSHFFKYSWRMTYLFYLKKIDTHMLLTIKFFDNEFSDFLFQLQILFYLMVHTYRETFHTLNHSESEIKFLSINWYKFWGYLVTWGGSSYANFNFHYHWNLFKNIKSPTCKSKTIKFHLGQLYCLNIINLGSTR